MSLIWHRDKRTGTYTASLQDGSAYRIENHGTRDWQVWHDTYERDAAQQGFSTKVLVRVGLWTLADAKEAAELHAARRNSPEWYFTEAHRKLAEALTLVAHGANAASAQGAEPVIQEAAGQYFTDARELSRFLVQLIKTAGGPVG